MYDVNASTIVPAFEQMPNGERNYLAMARSLDGKSIYLSTGCNILNAFSDNTNVKAVLEGMNKSAMLTYGKPLFTLGTAVKVSEKGRVLYKKGVGLWERVTPGIEYKVYTMNGGKLEFNGDSQTPVLVDPNWLKVDSSKKVSQDELNLFLEHVDRCTQFSSTSISEHRASWMLDYAGSRDYERLLHYAQDMGFVSSPVFLDEKTFGLKAKGRKQIGL